MCSTNVQCNWNQSAYLAFDYKNSTTGNSTTNGTTELDIADFPARYIVIIVLSSVLSVGGLLGNMIISLTILRCKKLHSPMNLFVLNLSICDLLIAVITIPYNVINQFIDWPFGHLACKYLFMPVMEHFAGVCVLTHAAISLARYNVICKVGNARFINRNVARVSITVIWSVSFAVMSGTLMGPLGTFQLCHNGTSCLLQWLDPKVHPKLYRVCIFMLTYTVPVATTGYAYIRMHLYVQSSFNNICSFLPPEMLEARRRKNEQVNKTLMTMFAMFTCTTLPLHVFMFLKDFCFIVPNPEMDGSRLHAIFSGLLILFYVQIVSNPVVLLTMTNEYRKFLKQAFSRRSNSTKVKVEGIQDSLRSSVYHTSEASRRRLRKISASVTSSFYATNEASRRRFRKISSNIQEGFRTSSVSIQRRVSRRRHDSRLDNITAIMEKVGAKSFLFGNHADYQSNDGSFLNSEYTEMDNINRLFFSPSFNEILQYNKHALKNKVNSTPGKNAINTSLSGQMSPTTGNAANRHDFSTDESSDVTNYADNSLDNEPRTKLTFRPLKPRKVGRYENLLARSPDINELGERTSSVESSICESGNGQAFGGRIRSQNSSERESENEPPWSLHPCPAIDEETFSDTEEECYISSSRVSESQSNSSGRPCSAIMEEESSDTDTVFSDNQETNHSLRSCCTIVEEEFLETDEDDLSEGNVRGEEEVSRLLFNPGVFHEILQRNRKLSMQRASVVGMKRKTSKAAGRKESVSINRTLLPKREIIRKNAFVPMTLASNERKPIRSSNNCHQRTQDTDGQVGACQTDTEPSLKDPSRGDQHSFPKSNMKRKLLSNEDIGMVNCNGTHTSAKNSRKSRYLYGQSLKDFDKSHHELKNKSAIFEILKDIQENCDLWNNFVGRENELCASNVLHDSRETVL